MKLINKIKNYSAKKIIAPAMIIGAGLFGNYQTQAQSLPIQVETTKGDFNSDGRDDFVKAKFNPNNLDFLIQIVYQTTKKASSTSINALYHKPRDDPIGKSRDMILDKNSIIKITSGDFNKDPETCRHDDLTIGIKTGKKLYLHTIYQTTKKASSTSMYGLYHKPRDDPIIMDIPENATFSLLSADYNSDGRDDLNVTINTDLESITYTIYQTTKKASSTSINGLYHKPRDDPITIKH